MPSAVSGDSAKDVAGRDTHDSQSARLKPRVAAYVALGPIADVMTHAVDLDRQPRLRAKEIEHVRADRVLTAKDRRSRRTLPQSNP
jgi:hypothetical protein